MRHRSRRSRRNKSKEVKPKNTPKGNNKRKKPGFLGRIGGWFKRQGIKIGVWAVLKEFQKKLGEQLKRDGKRTEIPVREIRSWFPWNRKKREKRHSVVKRGKNET